MSSYTTYGKAEYIKPTTMYVDGEDIETDKIPLPKITLEDIDEMYYPQVNFSYSDRNISIEYDDKKITLSELNHTLLAWKDDKGTIHVQSGKDAPYTGSKTKDGLTCVEYINELAVEQISYSIEITDKKTNTTKRYKLIEEDE